MGVVDGFSERMRNRSVDQILDEGAPGLQYWIQLESRYRRAFGGAGGNTKDGGYSVQKLEWLYDMQRGMNLAKLETAADSLNKMLAVAEEQGATQEQVARRLPSMWQGAAAEAGIEMLTKQVTLAAEDRAKVRTAVDAIRKTITPFRDAVIAKAQMTLDLLGGQTDVRIDGKSPADIDEIISGAQSGTLFTIFAGGTLADKLAEIFPDMAPTGSVTNFFQATGLSTYLPITELTDGTYAERLRKRCSDWLDTVFKPDYEGKMTLFTTGCETAHTAFEAQYATLAAALKALDDDPYPAPAGEQQSTDKPTSNNSSGTPSNNNSGNNSSGTPSSTNTPSKNTTPSSTNTPTTNNPTTNTPTTNVPSSTNLNTGTQNALQGLASLSQLSSTLTSAAGAAAQSLGTGLSSLGTTIKDGIDGALEKVTEAAKNVGTGKPLAEFDLAGKHLALEIGADGQPKLVSTEADGSKHEYSVKLNEHGIPVVVDSANPEHEPDSDSSKPQDKSAQGAGDQKSEKPGGAEQGGDKPNGDKPNSEKSGEGQPNKSEQGAAPQHPAGNSGQQPSGGSGNGEGSGSNGSVPKTPPVPRKEEDGEHTPKPMPGANAKPADSGAQLAEAGPL
ncbi:hypothetical protein [Nocardia bovistercoris]|uniref:Uncharacterized protein n=1 Tax=Nocardia bovistercoris TaxID=2785916 RepID=A0A931N0Q3_9NOCA|nr:hypothetical protein [Nocardia bovistercoris]MBH0777530.1 hypothetical protein [Nocardia bovistercoris]